MKRRDDQSYYEFIANFRRGSGAIRSNECSRNAATDTLLREVYQTESFFEGLSFHRFNLGNVLFPILCRTKRSWKRLPSLMASNEPLWNLDSPYSMHNQLKEQVRGIRIVIQKLDPQIVVEHQSAPPHHWIAEFKAERAVNVKAKVSALDYHHHFLRIVVIRPKDTSLELVTSAAQMRE